MSNSFDTKIKKVRDWLESGHSITAMDAVRMFNAYRLSAIIFELRKKMNIETQMITNGKSRFASYSLLKF